MQPDAPAATDAASRNHVPVPLKREHIENCRVIENRVRLLEVFPRGGVVAELGVLGGDYSQEILRVTNPQHLYLIDIFGSVDWPHTNRFDPRTHEEFVKRRFADEINRFQVIVKRGLSWDVLGQLPDRFFDWVYIDADHNYEGVRRDLEVAQRKVKDGGLLVLNDYIYYDHLGGVEYGVVHAVNEFCVTRNWEMCFLALHETMFNDVVLRRMK